MFLLSKYKMRLLSCSLPICSSEDPWKLPFTGNCTLDVCPYCPEKPFSTMALSSESLIALFGLLLTIPPILISLWKYCFRGRRQGRTVLVQSEPFDFTSSPSSRPLEHSCPRDYPSVCSSDHSVFLNVEEHRCRLQHSTCVHHADSPVPTTGRLLPLPVTMGTRGVDPQGSNTWCSIRTLQMETFFRASSQRRLE